ncbi:TetR/AcrR family transcriptional regulator [Acinetobacter stercoris]|uniref:Putative transcriptional regulator n=1 Tax=Acinetobacter stercoris TaxID=2126983 RepID=A0A2U3MYD9_9GAMM|nr:MULTISPECIES: TetR/AcrR family transcriptional regulator [Acinetobacter]SPL70373.1 putative transcriptional regulator [Acinetobacter stercoris]
MSKSALKILNTAEELFNQYSFTSVGVDLIRDESGCSKTTMYTYFKNKQHLVAEVLKTRDQRFQQSLIEYVGQHTGLSALDRIYDWHINWFQTDHFKGCLFVRAVAESSTEDTEILGVSKQHKIWLRAFIHQALGKNDHSQEIVELFYNVIEGLISRFLVEGFDQNIADLNKHILNTYQQALK